MSKKVDFRKVAIENVIGKYEIVDQSKGLGNLIYMQALDIEERDLGRKIFYEGEVELDEKQESIIRRFLMGLPMVVRTALQETLDGKSHDM